MQDGTKREVVSWKLSAAFFWWFLLMLNPYVSYMLLWMHGYWMKHMLENCRKWFQNLSKIDPGGALEASWEPPLKQCAYKTSFLTILAPFWDPRWDNFGLILGIAFLMCFWSTFWKALASIWVPKTPPKMRSKSGSKSKAEIHRFCNYLLHFGDIQGCWRSLFFHVCLETFWGSAFWVHFCDFGSLLRPFGDHFGHVLGTIFASNFTPPPKNENPQFSKNSLFSASATIVVYPENHCSSTCLNITSMMCYDVKTPHHGTSFNYSRNWFS